VIKVGVQGSCSEKHTRALAHGFGYEDGAEKTGSARQTASSCGVQIFSFPVFSLSWSSWSFCYACFFKLYLPLQQTNAGCMRTSTRPVSSEGRAARSAPTSNHTHPPTL
jgi:hypothetical protein